MGSSSDDYKIGYRRPPLETRWKPGQCGNPKGRPRKAQTVADDLRDALMRKIKIVENGRFRAITVQALIIRNLAHDAANKNLAAVRLLFALLARNELADEAELHVGGLDAEDRAILQAYISSARDAGDEPDTEG